MENTDAIIEVRDVSMRFNLGAVAKRLRERKCSPAKPLSPSHRKSGDCPLVIGGQA